jgi:hypothetical protein
MPTDFFKLAACMEKIICHNSLLPHSSKFIVYKKLCCISVYIAQPD